jgi:four helix bundle suffix protein
MSEIIQKHGAYRKLKSFQLARLVYDVTLRFVELYIDKFSRTKDQMVQAARSGVQNIAEGSLASATSKKTELKLTQVARASLEELRLDYEDFLRQRSLVTLSPINPVLIRFKNLKCQTLEQVQTWVADEKKKNMETESDQILSSACLAANAALSLINLACYFLDRQVERLAQDFERQGGFTERLYKVRNAKRQENRRTNRDGRTKDTDTRTNTD